MKVIFLDIDGVLNTGRFQKLLKKAGKYPYDHNGPLFDPDCVSNLSEIIKGTGAKIVIHSSWRGNGDFAKAYKILVGLWKERELPGEIIGITPSLSDEEFNKSCSTRNYRKTKGFEIEKWLSKNTDVESYIIIDDLPIFLKKQKDKFIRTNRYSGLTKSQAKIAIAILNGMEEFTCKSRILMRWLDVEAWLNYKIPQKDVIFDNYHMLNFRVF